MSRPDRPRRSRSRWDTTATGWSCWSARASQISVYDATYGTLLGSFTTPAGFDADALGSTDTLTVMGDVATNQLQEVDIPLSLAAGTAQLAGQ